MSADEEPVEGSPAAGACVLVVVGGVALAAVFVASRTAGILTLLGAAVLALWWSVRHTANPAPPPPPEGATNTNPQFTIVEDREGHCTVQWQKGVNGS